MRAKKIKTGAQVRGATRIPIEGRRKSNFKGGIDQISSIVEVRGRHLLRLRHARFGAALRVVALSIGSRPEQSRAEQSKARGGE